jgi:hypothetical protein
MVWDVLVASFCHAELKFLISEPQILGGNVAIQETGQVRLDRNDELVAHLLMPSLLDSQLPSSEIGRRNLPNTEGKSNNAISSRPCNCINKPDPRVLTALKLTCRTEHR